MEKMHTAKEVREIAEQQNTIADILKKKEMLQAYAALLEAMEERKVSGEFAEHEIAMLKVRAEEILKEQK